MDDLLQEMIQPAGPTASDRARRRRLVMSAATIALAVIGTTALTTSALFSDNDSADGGGFTTGSVDVALTPKIGFLTIGNMAPGDTEYRALTVSNPGSLEYRYAVTKTWTDDTTPALSGMLTFATYALPTGSLCSAATVAGKTAVRVADTVAAGSDRLLGDAATGQQAGDRVLKSQTDEVLCFAVTLPLVAGNEYQKATGSVAVKVLAEQTANN